VQNTHALLFFFFLLFHCFAGKTNVAMMCVLREIGAHIENGVLRKDQFKMVRAFQQQ
jgi:hypothetical protein